MLRWRHSGCFMDLYHRIPKNLAINLGDLSNYKIFAADIKLNEFLLFF